MRRPRCVLGRGVRARRAARRRERVARRPTRRRRSARRRDGPRPTARPRRAVRTSSSAARLISAALASPRCALGDATLRGGERGERLPDPLRARASRVGPRRPPRAAPRRRLAGWVARAWDLVASRGPASRRGHSARAGPTALRAAPRARRGDRRSGACRAARCAARRGPARTRRSCGELLARSEKLFELGVEREQPLLGLARDGLRLGEQALGRAARAAAPMNSATGLSRAAVQRAEAEAPRGDAERPVQRDRPQDRAHDARADRALAGVGDQHVGQAWAPSRGRRPARAASGRRRGSCRPARSTRRGSRRPQAPPRAARAARPGSSQRNRKPPTAARRRARRVGARRGCASSGSGSSCWGDLAHTPTSARQFLARAVAARS